MLHFSAAYPDFQKCSMLQKSGEKKRYERRREKCGGGVLVQLVATLADVPAVPGIGEPVTLWVDPDQIILCAL